jgi:UDP-N-acetyl-D-glucosamine dehydrogenase
MAVDSADLSRRVTGRQASVAVVGLGYVGLPLLVRAATAGHPTVGLDVDRWKLGHLRRGLSYVEDVSDAVMTALAASDDVTLTEDAVALADVDVVHICVQTPVHKATKEPNLEFLLSAMDDVALHARAGQLIIVESTTYPGATEELLCARLADRGLVVGADVFVAFSPERVDPANKTHDLSNTPKVVGGVTERCTELACAYYGALVETVVPVSSTGTAEMVKLLENTFRAVNIALVNEIAQVCHALDIDVWEVIDAAATKPFGFMPHYPGAGVGGDCIPADPHYLAWKARMRGVPCRLTELAQQINRDMPEYVVQRVSDALGRPVDGASILLVGVAYKPDVQDMRESPSWEVAKRLHGRRARVAYHDPYISEARLNGAVLKSEALSPGLLRDADCVLVLTPHGGIDYDMIQTHSRLVVDTKNVLAPGGVTEGVVRL